MGKLSYTTEGAGAVVLMYSAGPLITGSLVQTHSGYVTSLLSPHCPFAKRQICVNKLSANANLETIIVMKMDGLT